MERAGELAGRHMGANVGAAVESAISASALILDRCGRMTGHDPTAQVQYAQNRRAEIDALMKRATTSAWAHPTSRAPQGRIEPPSGMTHLIR